MATSGSSDFALTGSQIVTKALNLCAERAAEVAGTSNEISDGLDSLNAMTKAWAAQGNHLWAVDEGVLFMREGVQNYTLGGSTGDQATLVDDLITTTLTAAPLSGANTITVASTTGMQGLIDSGTADYIGIRLDDDTRQWTTIENVNSATSLQITDVLTSAAVSGDSVFTFSDYIVKPMRVPVTRRQTFGQSEEIPLDKWSRQQYFAQTLKSSPGTPTNFYYRPERTQGRLYVWQTANDVDQMMNFTFERQLHDFDETTDNPDFPVEWTECLIWNLAARIGPEYKIPLQQLQIIIARGEQLLDDLLGWDEELTSMDVQPDYG